MRQRAGSFSEFYRLTKPGIIYGNILTAAAGFLFAADRHLDFRLLAATMVGTSLMIAAAGVYNNLMDRRLDARMKRTARRPLITGSVSPAAAVYFGSVLLLVGLVLLIKETNWLVVAIGVIGLVDYLLAYGWTKRHSSTSTLVGSISGATPILAGYVAVTGSIDLTALLLFGCMTLWQMPHFYAIALFRANDYAAIGLPLMPLRRSIKTVAWRMRAYIVTFGVMTALLARYGHAGIVFAIIMISLTVLWLSTARIVPTMSETVAWGRRSFGYSLYVVLGLSLGLIAAPWLP